ncbi:MAG TPA: hypothetical protein VLX59_02375 [Acidimicrobiales bacterium]|nr:hypothetical protein [Acidimicrobiales bacterium]
MTVPGKQPARSVGEPLYQRHPTPAVNSGNSSSLLSQTQHAAKQRAAAPPGS